MPHSTAHDGHAMHPCALTGAAAGSGVGPSSGSGAAAGPSGLPPRARAPVKPVATSVFADEDEAGGSWVQAVDRTLFMGNERVNC